MASGIVRQLVRQWFGVFVLLTFPVAGYAQDATITGTVTDATGGVLPGRHGDSRQRRVRKHL